ncbi:hypothetical protein BDV96DRAFT_594722 [Lophiotrema nucula]|uniref:Myb-like DNA-binding domain-containing protein n=1 Tax=Lophiotrema nucula TaxID=690887 RepID=A0A6A5ZTF0_9PLEO|nr:hypothetical protein BDV96DRAFT_594722 [Lophiotrema nucula]
MPTDEENVQYLYLVLTHGGMPTIDWDKVTEDLELKKGATMKRWSRLKAAMTEGKPAGPTAATFLWLLVKHSARDKAMDWNEVAEKCGTTPGAASKRWSRLKQSIENGDGPPTPAAKEKADGEKKSPAKERAPKKAADDKTAADGIKNEGEGEGEEEKPKPKKSTPKKRAPKAVKEDADPEGDLDGEEKPKKPAAKGKRGIKASEGSDDNDEKPQKRARATKKTAAAVKKEPSASPDDAVDAASGSQDVIKEVPTAAEGEDEGDGTFQEANEQIHEEVAEVGDEVDAEAEDEILV